MVDKKVVLSFFVVAFFGMSLGIGGLIPFWGSLLLCAPYFVLITLELIQSFKASSTPEEANET